jgi:hypothetical protein
MIPPLLHTHPSLPLEMCDGSDQAAHYHILEVGGFISDPALGYLQSDEFKLLYIILCLGSDAVSPYTT